MVDSVPWFDGSDLNLVAIFFWLMNLSTADNSWFIQKPRGALYLDDLWASPEGSLIKSHYLSIKCVCAFVITRKSAHPHEVRLRWGFGSRTATPVVQYEWQWHRLLIPYFETRRRPSPSLELCMSIDRPVYTYLRTSPKYSRRTSLNHSGWMLTNLDLSTTPRSDWNNPTELSP